MPGCIPSETVVRLRAERAGLLLSECLTFERATSRGGECRYDLLDGHGTLRTSGPLASIDAYVSAAIGVRS